jgi:hypothetical protein
MQAPASRRRRTPKTLLAAPSGLLCPALDEKWLQKDPDFWRPLKEKSELIEDQWYYVTFNVEKDDVVSSISYLAKLISLDEEGAVFQHVEGAHKFAGTEPEQENSTSKLILKSGADVFQQNVYAASVNTSSKKDPIVISDTARVQGTLVVDVDDELAASSSLVGVPKALEEILADNPTLKRLSSASKKIRSTMLMEAMMKTISVLGDPENWSSDWENVVETHVAEAITPRIARLL